MADADNAKPGEDDAALLAVEATDPVVLQEPDRSTELAETDAPPAVPLKNAPKKQNSGLLGFVLGGALLAGGGFAAAKYALPDTGNADAIAALQTQIDAKSAVETELQAQIAALSARPEPDATLADRLSALEAGSAALADAQARIAQLEDRLLAIETASVSGEGAPAAALAAMGRELADLKAALQAQKGAVPAMTAEVEAASAAAQARLDAAELAAETAAKQAALSHIRAAFESGAPLGTALDGLTSLGVEIPVALVGAADAVPTLLSLQEGFTEPARAALDASIRANMGDGWANRLTSFLRTQSGARSLTPQEGADPDAVLSRAEAAVLKGELADALSELAGLPPVGAEAMAGWIAEATRRIDTEKAIADLSATLNGQ